MIRTLAVRNLPADVIEGLRQRAKRNNRSMEAEARELITAAVFGEKRLLTFAEWAEIEGKRTAELLEKEADFRELFFGHKDCPAAE